MYEGTRTYEQALDHCSGFGMHIISGLFEDENQVLWEYFGNKIQENGGMVWTAKTKENPFVWVGTSHVYYDGKLYTISRLIA